MYLGAILIGLGIGAETDLLTYTMSRYFPVAALGRALGAAWIFWAWGNATGVALGSLSFDLTGNYDIAMILFVTELRGFAEPATGQVLEATFKSRHYKARLWRSSPDSGEDRFTRPPRIECTIPFDEAWLLPLRSLPGTRHDPTREVSSASQAPISTPTRFSMTSAASNGMSSRYFDVGITNSAPFSMLSGQRCMIDFCRV